MASPSPRSLPELLARSAARYGQRDFLLEAGSGRAVSFAALHSAAASLAGGLREHCGVAQGEHVALLLPNCADFVTVYFGVLTAGATAVPVNIRLKAPELEFILQDSQARVLFVHPRIWPAAQAALRAVSAPPQVFGVGLGPEGPPEGVRDWRTLCAEKPAATAPSSSASPEEDATPPDWQDASQEVAAIIYTSGTTGRPKGAMLTHRNILFNAASTVAGHGLRPGDVHLLCVPLFHVTGLNTLLPTALAQGARLAVTAEIDPEELVETLARCGCTTFFGVPTTFYLLTNLKDLPKDRLRALRLICYSGAPMAPLTIRKLREQFPGVELHNFFGLTETTSVSTVLPDADALNRSESVGLPPPGVELAIVDEADRRLPPDEVGELVIRGPSVLVPHRRRRLPGPAGLSLPARAHQGADHRGRGKRVSHRGRERALRPPRRPGGGGLRAPG
jgi:acyl-CoA synthetase (AMP-forming)/AMP-acid ligase II